MALVGGVVTHPDYHCSTKPPRRTLPSPHCRHRPTPLLLTCNSPGSRNASSATLPAFPTGPGHSRRPVLRCLAPSAPGTSRSSAVTRATDTHTSSTTHNHGLLRRRAPVASPCLPRRCSTSIRAMTLLVPERGMGQKKRSTTHITKSTWHPAKLGVVQSRFLPDPGTAGGCASCVGTCQLLFRDVLRMWVIRTQPTVVSRQGRSDMTFLFF